MGSLAKRIRYYRNKNSLTQAEVAGNLDMQQGNYAKYESESDGRVPRDDTMLKLAKLFNISYESLRSGEEMQLSKLLHAYLVSAVLGEVEPFTSFFSDTHDFDEAYPFIVNIFSNWASVFEIEYKAFYVKFLENPTYDSMIDLYSLYCTANDEKQDCEQELTDIDSKFDFNLKTTYKLAFCIAMARYLDKNENQSYLRDSMKYHGIDRDSRKALQAFAVDLFGPYVAFLVAVLDMLADNDCFYRTDFENFFLYAALTPNDKDYEE